MQMDGGTGVILGLQPFKIITKGFSISFGEVVEPLTYSFPRFAVFLFPPYKHVVKYSPENSDYLGLDQHPYQYDQKNDRS